MGREPVTILRCTCADIESGYEDRDCPLHGWDDPCDELADDNDYAGPCKFGGSAPCVDDICHATGGCMGWQDYQP